MNTVRKTLLQQGPHKDSEKLQLLSARQYELIRQRLVASTGIELGENKQALVESRLYKRLTSLGLVNFSEYIQYLENDSDESAQFINCLTTNKTNWFREDKHFSYLTNQAIPAIYKMRNADSNESRRKPLYIWSAACSTGEEVYSLAMTLKECSSVCPAFRILGSDIDTEALSKAEAATYCVKNVEREVSKNLLAKYFENVGNEKEALIKISENLLKDLKFRNYNLIEDDLPSEIQFDIIFLRNVLIYFSRPTIEKVIARVTRYLRPEGYLFIGHTESLSGLSHSLVQVSESVYRFKV